MDENLDDDELFAGTCSWEDAECIVSCGTKYGLDTNDTDGIVDGHAYSILACEQDVAGSGCNLIKVRNSWGTGEFKRGKWGDDGPGWDDYPAVKEALNPVQANDGVFWWSRKNPSTSSRLFTYVLKTCTSSWSDLSVYLFSLCAHVVVTRRCSM